MLRGRKPSLDFIKPTPNARVSIRRKMADRKKLTLRDLEVWELLLKDAELARDEKHLVIPHGCASVLQYAAKLRLGSQLDARFFEELALQRFYSRLSDFDTAARELPSWHQAWLDEEDAPLCVKHRAANAERHSLRQRSEDLHGSAERLVAAWP